MASKRVLLQDKNGDQVMPITDAKNVYVSTGQTVYDVITEGEIEVVNTPIDDEPTEDSTNAVSSGGVYDAIDIFDISMSPNLLNLDTLNDGKFVNSANGTLANNANYTTTDYIPMQSNQTIRRQMNYGATRYDSTTIPYSSGQIAFYALYNSNQVYISGGESATTVTALENVAYIRLSFYKSSLTSPWSDNAIIISNSATIQPYHAYREIISKKVKVVNLPIDDNSIDNAHLWSAQKINDELNQGVPDNSITPEKTTFFDISMSPNLLNLDTLNDGKFVNSANGTLANNANYTTTDYIPVNGAETLHHQYDYNGVRYEDHYGTDIFAFMACYDENKTYISGDSNKKTYTPASNAKYVRLTLYKNAMTGLFSNNAIIISNSSAIIPFYPYGETIGKRIKHINQPLTKVKAYLPTEICCAVGRTIEIYNSQVCPNNSDNLHFKWDCTVGNALSRKFSITGTSSNIGNYALSLSIYDDDLNVLWSGGTTLKIVSDSISETFSICAIGDSLTNGKKWLAELINLNNNFDFYGTREGTSRDASGTARTFYHEGRSGWTAARYNQPGDASPSEAQFKYENPFYNSTSQRFDWNYYCGPISPNAVMIFLGINSVDLNATKAVDIKTLVDYIRTDDSTIPIYIVNTPYKSNQNGIGKTTNSQGYNASKGQFKYEEDLKVFNLMTKLDELLGSYSNLYFVPISLCFDSEYNYGSVATTVNPRASQTENMPVESVHPQDQGYFQFADVMYSVICAHNE